MKSGDGQQDESHRKLLENNKKGHNADMHGSSGNGSVLSFHDVTYSVRVREKGCACCARYNTKKILKEIRSTMACK